MSGKSKIKKRGISHGQNKIADPNRKKNSDKPADNLPAGTSLIFFDRRSKFFLFLLLALYIGFSLLKIHTSSIANFDTLFGIQESPSVLAGVPRLIRQDEWMINTPELIGQYQTGMPLSNLALGQGNVPVILGFPIKDFTMLLRPNLWPYFIFDIERAFAFSWNFNIFIFIGSSFLVFMLLTKNNFWISFLGSIFIFLSSANQWWSYSLGSLMIPLNLIFIAAIYLLYSKNNKAIYLAGFLSLLGSFNFLANLYPPWQIPLFYLYLFLIIGYVIKKDSLKTVKEKLWLKTGVALSAIIILSIFVYHYYGLVKDTYEALSKTVYPGKRSTNGGDLAKGKLFSEFFSMYLAEFKHPPKWLNICEASSFFMFFPILFYSFGYNYFKLKKWDWQEIILSFYVILLLLWMLLGFPPFLSKISLFSMSPTYCTLPVLGVANTMLLISYLGNKEIPSKLKFSKMEFAFLVLFVLAFVTTVAIYTNRAADKYFASGKVVTVSILFGIIYVLIRYKDVKYSKLVLGILLIGINIPNLSINPLTYGLSAALDNPVVTMTKDIYQKDPNSRWAVFGNQKLASLLKINGINVFNGVKHVPILEDMKVLDPDGKNNFIYNRYAHISMTNFINWEDSLRFKMLETNVDYYTIYIDACSPRLKKLGIKYFAFTYKPQDFEVRCMGLIGTTDSIYVYKRQEE